MCNTVESGSNHNFQADIKNSIIFILIFIISVYYYLTFHANLQHIILHIVTDIYLLSSNRLLWHIYISETQFDNINEIYKDFPGGPVTKTPPSQCSGHQFNPWSGNQIPHATTKTPYSQIRYTYLKKKYSVIRSIFIHLSIHIPKTTKTLYQVLLQYENAR